MTRVSKVCRVCGKAYEACRSDRVGNGFRWQDVSCSPECGAEYLRRIVISREPVENSSLVNHVDVNLNEEYDGFSEDTDGDQYDEAYATEFGADDLNA